LNDGSAAPSPQSLPLTPVIVGPTGAGKTAVAVALASFTPITVISADARQIYRGLDIGTAKPSAETLARVPHLGLDLIDPGDRYSAGRFARDAAGWLAEARAAQRQPVVVGGTGLYIRALAEGLFHEPPFDPARREQLRHWSALLEGPDLARWAGRLDPRFPGGGRQRAARAIEVALLTGHALSWWQRAARESGTLRPWYIHLTAPRELLHRRLAARLDQMLAAGFVEEVRGVLETGVMPDAPGLDGVGYREVVSMVQGHLPEAELRDAILVSTRRYAKRQDTWFRHQLRGGVGSGQWEPEVWTLDATEEAGMLARLIFERWRDRTTPHSPLSVS
jgi:tRNA dimethylallyltransferase